jgi:hypothetical protein
MHNCRFEWWVALAVRSSVVTALAQSLLTGEQLDSPFDKGGEVDFRILLFF